LATDVGRGLLDDRLRSMTADDRMLLHERMRQDAFRLVWAQADRAGISEPLVLTRFLLERLYPDLRGSRLDAIMGRFAQLEAAGLWSGPRRPRDDDILGD